VDDVVVAWLKGQESVTIRLFDRPQDDYSVPFAAKCVGVTDLGVWYEWESAGKTLRYFSPWANLSYIGAVV